MAVIIRCTASGSYAVSDPIGFAYDLRETKTWAVEARFATPTDGRWSAIVGAMQSV